MKENDLQVVMEREHAIYKSAPTPTISLMASSVCLAGQIPGGMLGCHGGCCGQRLPGVKAVPVVHGWAAVLCEVRQGGLTPCLTVHVLQWETVACLPLIGFLVGLLFIIVKLIQSVRSKT